MKDFSVHMEAQITELIFRRDYRDHIDHPYAAEEEVGPEKLAVYIARK